MKKSSRHSKITGDFAETLVLYWLSKYGYECARVDHTGIDLIAREPDGPMMGISVKSRSRYDGTEKVSVNLSIDGFEKVRQACEAFGCVPYYAVVVDGSSTIRGFLSPLTRVLEIAGGNPDGMRYWLMADENLARYRADPMVKYFELSTLTCSWREPESDAAPDQGGKTAFPNQ